MKLKTIAFSIILILLLAPLLIRAQTLEEVIDAIRDYLLDILDKITDFLFWIALAIAPIAAIVAAVYFLTAGGDPQKINTAKQIILYTFIGVLVAFSAQAIVGIVKGIIEGGPGPGPSCGNGVLNAGEECDPPQDLACPGQCQADCTCRGLTPAKLLILGDVNKDCKVDGLDVGNISRHKDAKPGDPNWNPDEDLNGNGIIDDCDAMIAANSFGLVCD
jgi:hypothetical protein